MGLDLHKHGGNLTEEARRLGVSEHALLDASASLVPFPPPAALEECLKAALQGSALRSYPDCSHQSLREAISSFHGIPPSMILPGNGAAELFTWAARDAATEGVSGLPNPGFSDYARALRCWDAPYIDLNLPLSWSATTPQPFPLLPKTDVLWITNPHNPTGQLWSHDSIHKLIKKHSLLICDEAFLPLAPNGEQQSLLPLITKYPNLVVIRSLTKLFGIAGLRLGYAVGNEHRLKKWQEWRDPWPLNGLAIMAGVRLMTDKKLLSNWINRVHQWVSVEGSWLYNKLNSIPGITAHPSAVNFILFKNTSSVSRLRERLSEKHILIRDCESFKALGKQWFRVSLQDRVGNQLITSAIQEIVN